MDQLELVDRIKAGHYMRTPSQNERIGKGERPLKTPNKTKPDPDEVCTQKESHLHIMERPSKHILSWMHTLPKYVESFSIFGTIK